jgi:hypothetical protein
MALMAAPLAFGVEPAEAPSHNKPPWEWSVQERLAARFDAAAVQKRVDAMLDRRHAQSGSLASNAMADRVRPADYIDGHAHPELFLPTEILTMFIRSAYAGGEDETADGFRISAAQNATELGLPGEFLAVFEREAQALIALQMEESALRDALSEGKRERETIIRELARLESEQCPLRVAVLQSLRKQYGSEVDRFLYAALAPGMSRVIFSPIPDPQALRLAEQGCR